MLWHGERQGQGVSLSGERSVAGRHAKKAWGVQLADQWMSKDVHVIALLLEQVRSTATSASSAATTSRRRGTRR